MAVVSVPGPYAAIAAHSALTAGLHVLLFSDNVPVSDEVALKRRASGLGRLVMGPGAGTAMLGGVGLGFANAVGSGPVGVVAAAGTGAQEVMTLLDRWGIGVSQVIGVGGRDLSAEVGGLMARDAVRALDADPGTEVILLVSKPPDQDVARTVIGASRGTPVVAACLGMSAPEGGLAGASLAATLEGGALRVAEILGRPAPDLGPGPGPRGRGRDRTGRGRPHRGARLLHRRHAVLRGPGDPQPGARPGVLEHPAAARAWPIRAGTGRAGRGARLPGPRRGGVHQGTAASDDRPGRPPGDPAGAGVRPRRRGGPARTSSSVTARTPTRPGRSPRPAPTSWPAGPRWSATCSARAPTSRDSTGSAPN